ncbi:MAG: amidohydrolase family protein [Anaerolineae bacterium]
MIIDAHAHIWHEVHGRTGTGVTRSLRCGRIQLGDEEIQLLPPLANSTSFPPEILLANMDWAGVDKAVLLQGSFYGENNALVAEACQQWPDRFVGAGYVDPRDPNCRDEFKRCVEDYGFHLLKFEMSVSTGFVGIYPDLHLDGAEMAWIWEEAAHRNLVVTLDLGAVGAASYQTDAVEAIITRYPTLRIVIAHLAQPAIGRHDATLDDLWQSQILLARHPNVWFDISALPANAGRTEDYPYPTACDYLRRAVALVGADKLMWGTDAPGLLSVATYPQLLSWVTRHCEFLSAEELKAISGETAGQLYF